jgi:imidazolonepropionase-like amidohydrolase
VVTNLHGATILPGFIDPFSQYGLRKESPKAPNHGGAPRYQSSTEGAFGWNEAVKPEFQAALAIDHDAKKANEWLDAGFTTLHIVPDDGIFRGTAALVSPGKATLQEALLLPQSAISMSFRKGSSQQAYPESLMGAIALIRQTLLDAEWYAKVQAARAKRSGMPPMETNLSLEALNRVFDAKLPIIFECNEWQDIFRAAKIASEYNVKLVFKSGSDAHKRAGDIAKLGATLIISLDFPEPFDLSDPAEAREIPLSKLMDWENAPRNPALLAGSKVPFAFTSSGLKKPKQVWEGLAKAIKAGLSQEAALAALTTTPAKIIGQEQRLGTLEPGKLANFVVYEENPFRTCEPVVLQVWSSGAEHTVAEIPQLDPRATYSFNVDGRESKLLVAGSLSVPKARVVLEKTPSRLNSNCTDAISVCRCPRGRPRRPNPTP